MRSTTNNVGGCNNHDLETSRADWKAPIIWNGRDTVTCAFFSRENVNTVISQSFYN